MRTDSHAARLGIYSRGIYCIDHGIKFGLLTSGPLGLQLLFPLLIAHVLFFYRVRRAGKLTVLEFTSDFSGICRWRGSNFLLSSDRLNTSLVGICAAGGACVR